MTEQTYDEHMAEMLRLGGAHECASDCPLPLPRRDPRADQIPTAEQPVPIDEKPCWTEDIDYEPVCRVHNAYWSKRQSYCEVLLTRHPELARGPQIEALASADGEVTCEHDWHVVHPCPECGTDALRRVGIRVTANAALHERCEDNVAAARREPLDVERLSKALLTSDAFYSAQDGETVLNRAARVAADLAAEYARLSSIPESDSARHAAWCWLSADHQGMCEGDQ